MARPIPENLARAAEPRPDVIAQAAAFVAHLESGEATEDDLAAMAAWRDEDRAHALALERMGGLGVRLQARPAVEREVLRRLFLRPRRRFGAGAALVMVLAVGAGLAVRTPAVQIRLADQRTATGEVRAVALADGGDLVLSTNSAVDLDFKGERRDVRLLRGEVLATVAKGRPRPFVVRTDEGSAQALGTRFTVRRDGRTTVVAVLQSHVRVCATGGEVCRTLGPGQQALIAAGRVTRLPDLAPEAMAAWSEGWLQAEDRPLVEILEELNRWRDMPIGFDRADLAGLRVSGVLPLKDTDRAVANLARLLPIEVDQAASGALRVRRR